MKKIFKKIKLFVTIIFISIIFNETALAQTLKFVQLTDIHLSNSNMNKFSRMLKYSNQMLEDVLSQIKSEDNLKFIIITGDGVDKPEKDLSKKLISVMNSQDLPWYWAFGNHDVKDKSNQTKNDLIKIINSSNPNQKKSKSYFSFDSGSGFKIVILDSIIEDELTSEGYIPKSQLVYLDNILKKSQDKTVLICMHHPIIPPFKGSNHELRNKEEILSLLKKYKNPIIIITGHYHANKIYKEDNLLFISSAALIQYPNAFRIIEIDDNPCLDSENFNDRKKYVKVIIRSKQINLKNIIEESKNSLFSTSKSEGDNYDKNNILFIEKK